MFPSARPEKGNSGQWYERCSLGVGKSVDGWLAGTIKPIWSHFVGGTEPCRRWISRHKLKCQFCSSNMKPVFKCYVPFFDTKGMESFIIVGERYFPLAKAIMLWSPITITKLKQKGTPIRVTVSEWTTEKPPFPDGNDRRRDISAWLFKLWKDDALKQWIAEHPEVNDVTEEFNPDPAPEVEERVKEFNRALVTEGLSRAMEDEATRDYRKNGHRRK